MLLEELGYACAASPFLSTAVGRVGRSRRAGPTSSAPATCRRSPPARRRPAWARASCAPTAPARPCSSCSTATRRSCSTGRRRRGAARRHRLAPAATPRCAAATGEPLGAGAADRVRAAVAAEVVGIAQRALDMTLAYVKDRKQFGMPVGAFQAVSHRCAQMLLDTESARSAAYFAAWAADADPERSPEAAALAGRRRGRRRSRRDRERDPGPRRHRLHLGGRRPLALQARPARRGLLGGARRHRAALARIAAERVRVTA